ncbi:CopG family transcriptional regulator [Rhodococcus opacus]|uniref:ribbon-helix-helix domain-containing protein n=1 Tax=Rhodococcus opacus TaxID=37919 RepID=UPI003CD02F8E
MRDCDRERGQRAHRVVARGKRPALTSCSGVRRGADRDTRPWLDSDPHRLVHTRSAPESRGTKPRWPLRWCASRCADFWTTPGDLPGDLETVAPSHDLRPPPPTARVDVALDDELLAHLDALADRLGSNRQELVYLAATRILRFHHKMANRMLDEMFRRPEQPETPTGQACPPRADSSDRPRQRHLTCENGWWVGPAPPEDPCLGSCAAPSPRRQQRLQRCPYPQRPHTQHRPSRMDAHGRVSSSAGCRCVRRVR